MPDYLQQTDGTARLILAPGDFPRMNALPNPSQAVGMHILIGPEGGFTDEEVELCLQSGVQAISLGPRILRAETASVTALALLQHLYGDL